MAEFMAPQPAQRAFNPIFAIGIVIGLAVIGAAIYALSFKPSMADQTAAVLADTIREGSSEFEELSRDIIISRSDNTVQSPTGLGTISMYIKGRVRNKGTRTFTALEINVAVVDQQKQVLREKKVLVVPVQRTSLGPDETIPVSLQIDGFSPADDRADIRWRVTALRVE